MSADFAEWLRDQLDARGLKPIDVERSSRRKPPPHEHRPVIDRSSVGNWLQGKSISLNLAAELAGILDVPLVEVMEAAGLPTTAADVVVTAPHGSGQEAFIIRLDDADELRAVEAFRKAWRATNKPDRRR